MTAQANSTGFRRMYVGFRKYGVQRLGAFFFPTEDRFLATGGLKNLEALRKDVRQNSHGFRKKVNGVLRIQTQRDARYLKRDDPFGRLFQHLLQLLKGHHTVLVRVHGLEEGFGHVLDLLWSNGQSVIINRGGEHSFEFLLIDGAASWRSALNGYLELSHHRI